MYNTIFTPENFIYMPISFTSFPCLYSNLTELTLQEFTNADVWSFLSATGRPLLGISSSKPTYFMLVLLVTFGQTLENYAFVLE